MNRAALWSVLGVVVGMASSVANAQYFYSPVSYYSAPVVQSVYSAPIPVGVSYYASAPVVVARPVYAPVVSAVYAAPAPMAYSYGAPSTVSYASYYGPTPIAQDLVYAAPAPVYVAAAPVVVSRSIYTPVVRQTIAVRPLSTTYRAHGYGWGAPRVYAHSNLHRTVVRTRGW